MIVPMEIQIVFTVLICSSLVLYALFILTTGMKTRLAQNKKKRQHDLLESQKANTLNSTSFGGQAYFYVVGESSKEISVGTITLKSGRLKIYDDRTQKPLAIAPYDAIRGVFVSEAFISNQKHSIEIHLFDDNRWQILSIPEKTIQEHHDGFQPLLEMFDVMLETGNHGLHRYQRVQPTRIETGFETTRKLTGDWLLKDLVTLCVTPLYLIITTSTGDIQYQIPLGQIKEVESLPDLANPDQSIVRIFTQDGLERDYAIRGYTLARGLAVRVADVRDLSLESIWRAPASEMKKKPKVDDDYYPPKSSQQHQS